MTDEAKALVANLRDEDSYYRIQEKHWCIDGEELERQRLAAAALIETQAAELAKFKALAETLAGAVKALMPTHINLRMPHPDDSFIVPLDVNMGELRALDAALRKWEEARDV